MRGRSVPMTAGAESVSSANSRTSRRTAVSALQPARIALGAGSSRRLAKRSERAVSSARTQARPNTVQAPISQSQKANWPRSSRCSGGEAGRMGLVVGADSGVSTTGGVETVGATAGTPRGETELSPVVACDG